MNRCNKYREWLNNAAAGSLAADREPELLVHAAECDACREAYNQTREAKAFAIEIDRGVASLISDEPSPHFHARLRARIAAEAPASRFSWRVWMPIGATATALALVLAVFVLRTHHTVPAAPATPASPEVAVNSPAPPISTNPPHAIDPGERSARAANHPAPVVHLHPHVSHVTSSEPEVIVEPGQLEAAMQFADAIRSGRINGQHLVAIQQQLDAPIEIEPIEIVPLRLPDPDTASDAQPDSSRP